MTALRLVRGALAAAEADAVRALAAAAERHDGVEPLGEQTLLDLRGPGAAGAVHVLAGDGEPVGYAQLGPERAGQRTAELVVAPGARGAGVGGALLAAVLAEARAAGLVDAGPDDSRPDGSRPDGAGPDDSRPGGAGPVDGLRLWAHGTLPAARALAEHAGLVAVRELWRMGRPLAPAPGGDRAPVALPDGVTLRAFDPARDEPALLAANAAAFAWHPEQGALTLEDLRAREAEPWFDAEDLLLAERGGELAGFAWLKVTPPVGELYVLGVVPAAQGGGLGRALTAAALACLVARGADHAVLYTEADNERAVRTYRAAGFTLERADTQYAP